MKHLLAALLLALSVSAFAQDETGSWTAQNIPNANRIDDIYFHGRNLGWTAGGWNFKVHKTTDGGETWTPLTLTNNQYLRCIEFFDENIGLCGSVAAQNAPQPLGSLYRTTDGGQTWTNVAPSISPRPAGICGLAKAGPNTMYGVGVWYGPAFVIKSTDQGATWDYIDMSAHAKSLIDAFFFNEDEGFVVGSAANQAHGGVILYTKDGGKTWTQKFKTDQMTDRIWKIQTPDREHFYAAIESMDPETETRFVYSNNKGATWQTGTVSSEFTNIQMIGFIDAMHGWTGGSDKIFETKNGGTTWEQIELGPTTPYFNKFFKVNDGTAYLSGRGVYKFSRDYVTGSPNNQEPGKDIHALDVSPNPATDKVTVKVNFGNPTMAQLFLYSASGRTIRTLFSDEANAGEQTFTFDVSGMPSQSLVIALQTNEGILIRKLLKK